MQRKISAQVAGFSQADMDQFVTVHPSQFAKRVIFATDQVILPSQELSPAVGEATRGAKSLEEVQQQLTTLKLDSRRGKGAIDSAILPVQLFDQLQAQKPDSVFFTRNGANGVFFKVIGSEAKPLVGPDAAKLAKELMARGAAEQIVKQAKQDARAVATYEGDYARIMKDEPANVSKDDFAK